MRKTFLLLLAAAAIVPAMLANQVQVGYPGSSYGPYQTGVGGEFTLNPLTGWLDLSGYVADETKDIGAKGTFQTFCVEGAEYIYPYATIYNATLNTKAVWGSMPGTGDPISVGTGWLYKQFATGSWETGLSYDYSNPGRSGAGSSAYFLQRAIWWLEGEEGVNYSASNPYMAAVVAKFGSQDNAKADGAWDYEVWALNLTNPSTGAVAQDQLVYMHVVPDGGLTLMLLGLGLGGVGLVSRKLRK